MILKHRRDGTTEPYTAMQMSKVVRKLRDRLALPSTFTLDACRHGGMTELEEAELTGGQGWLTRNPTRALRRSASKNRACSEITWIEVARVSEGNDR